MENGYRLAALQNEMTPNLVNRMKIQIITILTLLTFTRVAASEITEEQKIKSTDMDTLELTQEWDKTFLQSDKVEHSKITFHNRYGITLAADLYKPKMRRALWLPSP